jgi:lipid-binding SYLF domain-containing protein
MTMNGYSRRLLTAALLGAVALGAAACTNESSRTSGSLTEGSDRAAIDRDVTAAIADLYARNPAARTLGENADAMLVFPSITTAGIGLGGSYGTGALRQGGQTTAYYNLIAGSIGWQLGAQSFSQVYFFNSPEALQTFKDTKGFEAGVGVTAVAADFGAGGDVTSSTLQEPVVVITWGQTGLMAGATVEGVKMTEIHPD